MNHGMTDTMSCMHDDAQFAGSLSVSAHVEMVRFLGMGNNLMVGVSVAVVAIEEVIFFYNTKRFWFIKSEPFYLHLILYENTK